MLVKTTETTKIELTEEETKILWNAYNIIYDLAFITKTERGEGLTDSHYGEVHRDELESVYRTLEYLAEIADDDIFKVF